MVTLSDIQCERVKDIELKLLSLYFYKLMCNELIAMNMESVSVMDDIKGIIVYFINNDITDLGILYELTFYYLKNKEKIYFNRSAVHSIIINKDILEFDKLGEVKRILIF